jgi:hypothetical protein
MDKVTPIGSPKGRKTRKRAAKPPSRSSALVEESQNKAMQAYQMRIAGKLPSEISEVLGIVHEDDVSRLMMEKFRKDSTYLTDQERKTLLGLELVRLEALQAAVWPAAMMGDPKSVDSSLRIMQHRARITGMEQVDPVIQKNLVLVMGEKEEDYINALKATNSD